MTAENDADRQAFEAWARGLGMATGTDDLGRYSNPTLNHGLAAYRRGLSDGAAHARQPGEPVAWIKSALGTLAAYEADYGEPLSDNHELGRIDESRGAPSFRIRVGHIRQLASLAHPAPPAPVAVPEDLEEVIQLAEVGEFLYSARLYSYGDGRTEPCEMGIDWQWQQSAPGQYGQGALLAEADKWHDQQAEDGTITKARKLRAMLSAAPIPPAGGDVRVLREALEQIAKPLEGICIGDPWAFYADLQEVARTALATPSHPEGREGA